MLLGLSIPAQAAHGPVPAAFQVRIVHRATAETVQDALRGAAERLERPACQAVFSDFSDTEGQALSARLAELGQSPQAYLGQILFYDGSSQPRCENPDVLAFTYPRSPVVFVCREALRKTYWRQPFYVEATLIHEALHTLGLGENPPTSLEVTSRVMRRCRR